MSGINLLPTEVKNQNRLLAVKRWIMPVTTVALVVYLVGAAGVLGWWLFLTIQNKQVDDQLASLTAQIQSQRPLEIAIRQVSSRTDLANAFLLGRVDVASIAATLQPTEQVAINSWKYAPEGQALQLTAGQLAEAENYGLRLSQRYPKIGIPTMLFSSTDPNWAVTLKL